MKRFAQRARRQQQAIACSTCVEDGELDAAGQAGVLQAVITEHHVQTGVAIAQHGERFAASASGGHGQARRLREQHGLIAVDVGIGVRVDHPRVAAARAIAAGQQPDAQPAR